MDAIVSVGFQRLGSLSRVFQTNPCNINAAQERRLDSMHLLLLCSWGRNDQAYRSTSDLLCGRGGTSIQGLAWTRRMSWGTVQDPRNTMNIRLTTSLILKQITSYLFDFKFFVLASIMPPMLWDSCVVIFFITMFRFLFISFSFFIFYLVWSSPVSYDCSGFLFLHLPDRLLFEMFYKDMLFSICWHVHLGILEFNVVNLRFSSLCVCGFCPLWRRLFSFLYVGWCQNYLMEACCLGYVDMEFLIQWGLTVCIFLNSPKSQASNIGQYVAY
jgi:hypothetical protein